MGFRWDFDGRLMVVHGYRLRFSRRTAVRWILYFYMVQFIVPVLNGEESAPF